MYLQMDKDNSIKNRKVRRNDNVQTASFVARKLSKRSI